MATDLLLEVLYLLNVVPVSQVRAARAALQAVVLLACLLFLHLHHRDVFMVTRIEEPTYFFFSHENSRQKIYYRFYV